MNKLLSTISGFFMSVLSIFHQGTSPPVNTQPIPTSQVVTSSALKDTPPQNIPPQNTTPRMFREQGGNLPTGEQRFFGTVTSINGSTLTLRMQVKGRPMGDSKSAPDEQQTPATVNVTLDSSTTYTGGSQSDITTTTRIAGVGKANDDGSVTALQVQINPTIPSGFPRRPNINQ